MNKARSGVVSIIFGALLLSGCHGAALTSSEAADLFSSISQHANEIPAVFKMEVSTREDDGFSEEATYVLDKTQKVYYVKKLMVSEETTESSETWIYYDEATDETHEVMNTDGARRRVYEGSSRFDDVNISEPTYYETMLYVAINSYLQSIVESRVQEDPDNVYRSKNGGHLYAKLFIQQSSIAMSIETEIENYQLRYYHAHDEDGNNGDIEIDYSTPRVARPDLAQYILIS